MNLKPSLQKKLYGFDEIFSNLKNLYDQNKLPNRILFSGQKGIGKCTLAYHLSNYILSLNEKHTYNLKDNEINESNKSYKLVINNSHPNFYLIHLKNDKSNIEISQIRKLIEYTNKSSFNNRHKIIIIDNIESLNLNSVNALLKIIEEPNDKILFFLIHDIKRKIIDTLRSRCIQFKLSINNNDKVKIINLLTEDNFVSQINKDFVNYYNTPSDYINYYFFCVNNNIDFQKLNIENFLHFIINGDHYKKNSYIKDNLSNYLELFFSKKIKFFHSKKNIYKLYNYFTFKMHNVKKYNLDLDSFLLEFNTKLLND